MNEKQTILLVDDSDDDLSLLKHACRAAHFKASLQTVPNGEEAIAYLKGEGAYSDRVKFPLPIVMLLDLNVPIMNGFAVLMWVRTQPALRRLTIITLTASTRPEDVGRAFDLGTNSYLVKPATMAGLVAMICCLRDWLEYNHFPPLRRDGKSRCSQPPFKALAKSLRPAAEQRGRTPGLSSSPSCPSLLRPSSADPPWAGARG